MTEDILRRGRLSAMNGLAKKFTSSTSADRWLFEYDIMVDIAHALMLKKQALLPDEYANDIIKSLGIILKKGYENLNQTAEDVHIGIESALIDLIGEERAGRLHTGRSRNDEVATCIRMALREHIVRLMSTLTELRIAFLEQASQHVTTLIPGFTHLQHAQPTTLAHHWLAHFDALERDNVRLFNCYNNINMCPLGAAAFASTGFLLDREFVASILGFDGIIENSIDAVSTRDFAIECLAALSLLMLNLSRIAEELILWSTSEFGYIEISDSYASTSSIMPQKKNPDTLELIRAKTGSVVGALTSALTICKALPYSYNLDLQEVTIHLKNAMADATDSTAVMKGVINGLTVNIQRLKAQCTEGFTTATELADTIVRQTKIPFRTAHAIVGEVARKNNVTLEALDDAAQKRIGKTLSGLGLTQTDIIEALDPSISVERRALQGGPAPEEVVRMINVRREGTKNRSRQIRAIMSKLHKIYEHLFNLTEGDLTEATDGI